jgi:mRNA interferase RelE/StbE
MYRLSYKKAALKVIRRLPSPERSRILATLEHLATEPDDPALDARPLRGREGYRLRVGHWRVLYHRNDSELVILVVDVGSRGGIYK